MRPIELTVSGFTCFPDPQPVLDFSHLDLFAISGPTGAGKSSLLDAIIYALYGKVPRLERNVSEFIAHGRDRLSVRLDFLAGGRRYRVVRIITRRARATTDVELEEVIGGLTRGLETGAQRVNARIQAIVGLDYDAFRQAVVLPQGDFQRFLKSQPSERREILRNLLRLNVYEEMRRRANERAGALQRDVTGLTRLLAEQYDGVTREALTDAQARAALLQRSLDEAEQQWRAAEQHVQRLRPRRGQTVEREQRRARRAALLAEADAVASDERALATSRRAAPVIPLLDRDRELATRASEERRRSAAADSARVQAEQALAAARGGLDASDSAAADLPLWRERVTRLDQVAGVVAHRDQRRAQLLAERGELTAASARARDAAIAAASAREQASAARATLVGLEARSAAIGYDAARDAALDGARDRAARVAALRPQVAARSQALALAIADAARAATAADAAAAVARVAVDACARAERRLTGAREALEHAREHERAAALRAHLAEGQPCPVCDQLVSRVPAALAGSGLSGFERELETAQAMADAARAEDQRALAALAASSSAREHADRTVTQARAAREGVERELAEAVVLLVEALGDHAPDEGMVALEEWIGAEAATLARLRLQHERAQGDLARAQQGVTRADAEASRAEHHAALVGEALAATQRRVDETAAALAAVETQVRAVAGEADPAAERAALVQRIRDTEAACDEARHGVRRAEARHEADAARAAETARVAAQSLDDARLAGGQAARALREAGFDGAPTARTSVVTADEERRLVERVQAYRDDLRGVEAKLSDLDLLLAAGEVTAIELVAAERACEQAKQRQSQHVRAEADARSRAEGLAAMVARAESLAMELEEKRAEHVLQAQLAEDLQTNRFQAFLLEDTFQRLVDGASDRLRQLTGRYTLAWDTTGFFVLDHDNAGERRSVETLSGGETFLASLALALELSAQVQRVAGAVSLDSLFIDEGFGTLDAETLDVVTGAIESLQVGGRMVGIITHIRELTDRLPACILVEKRPEGSRWRLRDAAPQPAPVALGAMS